MSVGSLLLHKYPEKFWILQVMKHPQRFEPNAELTKEDVRLLDLSKGQPLLNPRGYRPAIQSVPWAGPLYVKPLMPLHYHPRVSEVVADDRMHCVAVHTPVLMIMDGRKGD